MLRIVNRMSINVASRALAVRFGSSGHGDHQKHGSDHGHAKHGHDNHDHHHDPEELPLPPKQVHEGKAGKCTAKACVVELSS